MVEKYGEDKAEEIVIQTLKEIDNNDLAEKLKKACSDGLMASPSATPSSVTAPAAPATMLAQDRGAIIAPTINNSTTGAINITFSST
ncbi:hypothetical protein OJAV_G00003400 [Oryzias javanicus]|uniref:Uncharacterized protein n=1 Tax=Oryzias javanicus TaxID=123683 RepID=A0A3S2PTL5_ORYJA|nr:hypothetical protein OJAV_G00003400 [Oryzias javanicus]